MHRFAAVAAVLGLVGCSSPATGPYAPPDAASSSGGGGVQPAHDGGVVVDVGDSAPAFDLFRPCASDSDCAAGFSCYLEHTPASWVRGDIYGRCTIRACYSTTSFLCNAQDGTCVCPPSADGVYPNCQVGAEGIDPTLLICVPING